MKKLFSAIIISTCLVAGSALSVSAAETTDLLNSDYLTTESGGTWDWNGNTLTASNVSLGDTAIMSDIFVEPGEHVVLEATATVNDGAAWGIILSEVDPTAPFASWLCLNMDLNRPSTRLFGPGVGIPNEAELINPDFIKCQPYTLALEVCEDGTFKTYFNGELYGERINESWIGGYVGLMTWNSSTTFSDFKITYLDPGEKYEFEKIEMVVVEQPYEVRNMTFGETTNLLNEESFKSQVNGEFNWVNGTLSAPNAELGDCAYMTDYFVDVDDHVYIEVTGNLTSGAAFGIMMGRNGYENPFESWMCMNMEITRPSTRLFGPGFASEVQLYSYDFTNNKPLTIGLEIDNGTFYLYSEGKLFGYIENTEWQGCYLGLMTWTGSCEFTAFSVSEVKNAEQYTVYPDGTATAANETVVEPADVVEPVEKIEPVKTVEIAETTAEPTEAPQTFDVIVVCLAAVAVSGTAFVVSKKKIK